MFGKFGLRPCSRAPRTLTLRICTLGGLLFAAGPAAADYLDIVPSLAVKQEYADNLFYTVNKTGDLISTVVPALEFQRQTERLDEHFSGALRGEKYWLNPKYDTVDFNFLGGAHYQPAPNWNLTGSAEYDRFTGPSINSGNPYFTAIDLVRRYQQLYSVSGEYRITPRSTLIAAYSYNQNDYTSVPLELRSVATTPPASQPPSPPSPPPPIQPPGNGDNGKPESKSFYLTDNSAKVHAPSLTLGHSFDERTNGTLVAAYSRFLYKYSTADNYELTAGVNRNLNEVWLLSLTAGGRRTTSSGTQVMRTFSSPTSFVDELQYESSQSWGWVGQAALTYSGELDQGSLSLSRNVTQGRLGANQSSVVALSMNHRFTYELQGNLSASYQYDQAGSGEFGSNAVSDRMYRLGVGMHYDFTKDVSLDGGYSLSLADVTGVKISQNNLFLNLVVKYPLFN